MYNSMHSATIPENYVSWNIWVDIQNLASICRKLLENVFFSLNLRKSDPFKCFPMLKVVR